MLELTAQNLLSDALIEIDLGGSLDGLQFVAIGPFVLMHGDRGKVVGKSSFPVITTRGPALVTKYVVEFINLGRIRLSFTPHEVQKAFALIKQGEHEFPAPPPSVGGPGVAERPL